jgi:uncharacterized protein YjbI with pentapeptide repeats
MREAFATDLLEAIIWQANLQGANLQGAQLQEADLTTAQNLTQRQVNTACVDKNTKLPEGLIIGVCVAMERKAGMFL